MPDIYATVNFSQVRQALPMAFQISNPTLPWEIIGVAPEGWERCRTNAKGG
ncbi:hypothetical protein [Dyadobacter psychrotolerans]|uniref:hypothetical protein n=1 Tax=Dyadobacter psychrotolerans TaxID=2541721 RepID=UPI001404270D|nr:hypothetical protein [Dyadobacter psychrotolerans]